MLENQFGETSTDTLRAQQSTIHLENRFGESSTDAKVQPIDGQTGETDLDAIPSDNQAPRPG